MAEKGENSWKAMGPVSDLSENKLKEMRETSMKEIPKSVPVHKVEACVHLVLFEVHRKGRQAIREHHLKGEEYAIHLEE